ncbi:F-box only protein 9 [Halotydeus destructor]|nr:F-box only protein 9 [Halotydeus destructor]
MGSRRVSSEEASSLALDLNDDEKPEDLQDTLEKFRSQWRQELQIRQSSLGTDLEIDNGVRDFETDNSSFVDSEAKYLFEQGSKLEQCGKLYEAVSFYRRATQIDPDVEFKMYKLERQNLSGRNSVQRDNPDDIIAIDEDLLEKFNRCAIDEQGNVCFCFPGSSTSSTHISSLPYEVLMNILKWVVSADLDTRSVEQVSLVCRGFYLLARDSETWRLAAIRTWGLLQTKTSQLEAYQNCWRNMYINRPRPNFNGTYISRTTYLRHGESSFQDANYRPCYLVEYYRYLRFFPGGVVLMLTTPDDPQISLPKLKFRKPKSPLVLSGHYCLLDNRISAGFKRIHYDEEPAGRKRGKMKVTTTEQKFQVEVQLNTVRGMKNHQLIWTNYSVTHTRGKGPEAITTFDLSLNKFPPFYFSRVKNYCVASESPLM